MKRSTVGALLIGAGAIALIIAIVVIVAVSVGAGKQSPTPSATTTSSASSTPTSPPSTTPPSPTQAASPTTQPAEHATAVARRGISPLYQLIERSCDEPDTIDVDGWRIDGDSVIYRVYDDETDWSSTASTSFAALDAGGTSPVFITDARDWASNGCSP